jgi:hypothetical protein
LVREVTKNPMVTYRAPEFLFGDGRTFQKYKHLQHSTNQAFMVKWPDGSNSLVKKAHDSPLWGLP